MSEPFLHYNKGMKFSYPSGTRPLEGYTIKRGIGVGGFGEVYFAISDAGKEVALKKIQRNLDIELRGVRHCLNLKHVNLIELWDIRTSSNGDSWVVMEYVPGKSLCDVVHNHPDGMPELQIQKWFAATAAGVAHLHKHGIVHRDLKPANIFRDDDEHVVKIGDYGLSKFISCNRRSGHTESVGTFHYMAPEIGKGVYGKEIDIYAMGIMLYEMLTGDVPFDGESAQEIIMKHLTDDVRMEKVPPAFHRVITGTLAKDPQERFGSIGGMLKEIPWRALAANHDKIHTQHSVGFPVDDQGTDAAVKPSTGASVEPLFISGESLKIVRPEIVFGSPQDSSVASEGLVNRERLSRSTAEHPSSQVPNAISAPVPAVVEEAETNGDLQFNGEVLASQVVENRQWSLTDQLKKMRWWWTESALATVVKLLLLVAAGVFVLSQPTHIVPLAVIAGGFCLAAYMVRHRVLPVEAMLEAAIESPVDLKATHVSVPGGSDTKLTRQEHKLISAYGMNERQLKLARRWLQERSWRERLTEFTGALLVAAISCIVLNLLAVAARPISETVGDVPINDLIWSHFAWLTVLGLFASGMVLLVSKFWEHRQTDGTVGRIVMMFAGVLIGTLGWTMADYFCIGLGADLFATDSGAWTSPLQVKGVPRVAAWLAFFVSLFGVLRWWHQADPLRRTRLSLWTSGVCFVWAVILSHMLGQPVARYCVVVVIVSIAIQLAAPWISFRQRKKIYLGRNL